MQYFSNGFEIKISVDIIYVDKFDVPENIIGKNKQKLLLRSVKQLPPSARIFLQVTFFHKNIIIVVNLYFEVTIYDHFPVYSITNIKY